MTNEFSSGEVARQRQGGPGDAGKGGAEEKFPSRGGVARQRQGGITYAPESGGSEADGLVADPVVSDAKPRQPIALRVISVLAGIFLGITFASVLSSVIITGYISGGTTIELTSDQAGAFRAQPGRYSLVAEIPQGSTASSITCSGTQSGGSVITITPHIKALPAPLFQGSTSDGPATYRLADFTITEPNPTLLCHGTWSSMKIVPAVTAGFQNASRWILLGFLALVFIYGFASIKRDKHPATSNNGLWYGIVVVTFVVSIFFNFAPDVLDVRTADHSSGWLPKIPACSMDAPAVISSDSATGLSYDKAYLLREVGVTICLSSPEPFSLAASTALPDGQPMVLLFSQMYAYAGGYGNIALTATSNGASVTGISGILFRGSSSFPSMTFLNSIFDPGQLVDSTDSLTTRYLAYATTNPSQLTVTMAFWLGDSIVTASFTQ